jgi:hypothetical protein
MLELRLEEERLASSVSRGHETAAMGTVPFSLSADLTEALRRMAAGGLDLIVASVDDQATLGLRSSGPFTLDALLAVLAMVAEPRFAVVRPGDGSVACMLYAPEGCRPQLKMMYATAKASFVSQLEALGIKPVLLQVGCVRAWRGGSGRIVSVWSFQRGV